MLETYAINAIYTNCWKNVAEIKKANLETGLHQLFDDLNSQIDKVCSSQLSSKKHLWQIYKQQLFASLRPECNLGYLPAMSDEDLNRCCLTYVCGAMSILAGVLTAAKKACDNYGHPIKVDGLIGQCCSLFALGPKKFVLWLGGILDLIGDNSNIWTIFVQTGSITPFLNCTWHGQPVGGSLLSCDEQDFDDIHSIKDCYKIFNNILATL